MEATFPDSSGDCTGGCCDVVAWQGLAPLVGVSTAAGKTATCWEATGWQKGAAGTAMQIVCPTGSAANATGVAPKGTCETSKATGAEAKAEGAAAPEAAALQAHSFAIGIMYGIWTAATCCMPATELTPRRARGRKTTVGRFT